MAKGTVMSDSIKTVLCRVKNGYYVADIMAHRDIHTLAGRVNELERENAALREDNERMKERLELIQSVSYLEPLAWGKAVQAAIDSARKEAQP